MHKKVKKAIEKLADALHCRPLDLLKERDVVCFLRKTLLEEFGRTMAVRVNEDDMPGIGCRDTVLVHAEMPLDESQKRCDLVVLDEGLDYEVWPKDKPDMTKGLRLAGSADDCRFLVGLEIKRADGKDSVIFDKSENKLPGDLTKLKNWLGLGKLTDACAVVVDFFHQERDVVEKLSGKFPVAEGIGEGSVVRLAYIGLGDKKKGVKWFHEVQD